MPLPPLKAVPGHPGIATDPQGRYWVRIKLGREPFRELRNSLTDAIQRRDALRVEYRRKKALPGHRHYVNPGKVKLCDWIEIVRQRQRDLVKKSTLRRYGVSEKALLDIIGGDIYLTHITQRVVEDFRERRRREVEPASVNRDLTRLNTLLTLAVEDRFIDRVPFKFKREKLREPEGRIRVLTEVEEEELMLAAEGDLRPMIQFALLTGFRLREHLGLLWSDVHRTRIVLPGSRTKTSRRRTIPITKKVQAVLDEQKGKSDKWVFPNRTDSNCWDAQNFYRSMWNPARDRAGLLDFRWHDLRHTFCSRLIARGANIVAVKELAGHRSIEITMRYVHLSPDHLVQTMNLL